jgi:hypothetical protein
MIGLLSQSAIIEEASAMELAHRIFKQSPCRQPILCGLPDQMALGDRLKLSFGVRLLVNEGDLNEVGVDSENASYLGDKSSGCQWIILVGTEPYHGDIPPRVSADFAEPGSGSPHPGGFCGLDHPRHHPVTFSSLVLSGTVHNPIVFFSASREVLPPRRLERRQRRPAPPLGAAVTSSNSAVAPIPPGAPPAADRRRDVPPRHCVPAVTSSAPAHLLPGRITARGAATSSTRRAPRAFLSLHQGRSQRRIPVGAGRPANSSVAANLCSFHP